MDFLRLSLMQMIMNAFVSQTILPECTLITKYFLELTPHALVYYDIVDMIYSERAKFEKLSCSSGG